jgi:hypothetical protein
MTKMAGSGSISQWHGSADPDPPQNVMDPQHSFVRWLTISGAKSGLSYDFPQNFFSITPPGNGNVECRDL